MQKLLELSSGLPRGNPEFTPGSQTAVLVRKQGSPLDKLGGVQEAGGPGQIGNGHAGTSLSSLSPSPYGIFPARLCLWLCFLFSLRH